MRPCIYLVPLSFLFIINAGFAQVPDSSSCTFSKDRWMADSTGKTGYRDFVDSRGLSHFVHCPYIAYYLYGWEGKSYQELVLFLGPPNHIEKSGTGISVSYNIYHSYSDEEPELASVLSFQLNANNVILYHLRAIYGG
ncbi:MAG: hypothetical protein AB8F95_08555 [Bacteroidia bacterium]